MFDTHQHIKDLQSAGFNEKQAEVIVKSLLQSRDTDISHLATREQVSAIEKSTKEQLNTIREELRALIAETHASTLKWMIGTMMTFSGIIFAIVRFVK